MRFRGSLAAVWGRCIYTHKCTLSEICLRGILAAHWGICIYTYKYVHTSRWNSASLLKQCLIQNSALSKQHICTHFEMYIYVYILRDTGWRRLLGSPKLQIIFFSTKEPLNIVHFCEEWPIKKGILWVFATLYIYTCTHFEMHFWGGLLPFGEYVLYIYVHPLRCVFWMV